MSRPSLLKQLCAVRLSSMFDVHVETLHAGSRQIFVVRDDLLGGGTKERACRPFLEALDKPSYAYASPFCGFAQVALAKSAREIGAACTIFAEHDPRTEDAHEFTKLAALYGARIELCETLTEASLRSEVDDAFTIPLGFDHPDFHAQFEKALRGAWTEAPTGVTRVWLPLGSGTFSQVMRKVVPLKIELALVDVGVLPINDPRILRARDMPNVSYHRARERFADACVLPPPIPSNRHYDAKLWGFLLRNAGDHDLWWNVAR